MNPFERATAVKRVLLYPKLREKVGYSRQWLSHLEKLNLFPRRIHLGENRVGWLEDEVDAWIEARAAERGQVAA